MCEETAHVWIFTPFYATMWVKVVLLLFALSQLVADVLLKHFHLFSGFFIRLVRFLLNVLLLSLIPIELFFIFFFLNLLRVIIFAVIVSIKVLDGLIIINE